MISEEKLKKLIMEAVVEAMASIEKAKATQVPDHLARAHATLSKIGGSAFIPSPQQRT